MATKKSSKKSEALFVRLSPVEKKAAESAAADLGISVAEWARRSMFLANVQLTKEKAFEVKS